MLRQVELNNCENGSLNMEINDDEEIVMKSKSSLYLKSAEADYSISSEENADDNETGKNQSQVWSKALNSRTSGVRFVPRDGTATRKRPQDIVLGESWGRCVSWTAGHLTARCRPVWFGFDGQTEEVGPHAPFRAVAHLCWLFRACEDVTHWPWLWISKSFELGLGG